MYCQSSCVVVWLCWIWIILNVLMCAVFIPCCQSLAFCARLRLSLEALRSSTHCFAREHASTTYCERVSVLRQLTTCCSSTSTRSWPVRTCRSRPPRARWRAIPRWITSETQSWSRSRCSSSELLKSTIMRDAGSSRRTNSCVAVTLWCSDANKQLCCCDLMHANYTVGQKYTP